MFLLKGPRYPSGLARSKKERRPCPAMGDRSGHILGTVLETMSDSRTSNYWPYGSARKVRKEMLYVGVMRLVRILYAQGGMLMVKV